MAESKTDKPTRGIWFGFFLGLWILSAAFSSIHYLFQGAQLLKSQPDLPWWGVPFLAFLSLVQLLCYYSIWNWRQWAVYGALGSGIILFLFKSIFFDPQPPVWSPGTWYCFSGPDSMSTGMGLLLFVLWLVIFGLLMRAKWPFFK